MPTPQFGAACWSVALWRCCLLLRRRRTWREAGGRCAATGEELVVEFVMGFAGRSPRRRGPPCGGSCSTHAGSVS